MAESPRTRSSSSAISAGVARHLVRAVVSSLPGATVQSQDMCEQGGDAG